MTKNKFDGGKEVPEEIMTSIVVESFKRYPGKRTHNRSRMRFTEGAEYGYKLLQEKIKQIEGDAKITIDNLSAMLEMKIKEINENKITP